MIVTFISECEKKALNRTRRVLDAFANRIGKRTWQTVMTQEGLNAVKKLLRKSASKNTAVSCHWIRSRSRSEFLWVVGNCDKFNLEGIVPVNYTQKDGLLIKDESHWKNIEVIAQLASIAGLFHDFGKSNQLFQDKLNPDKKGKNYEPYRHEWLSFRLFQAFVGDKTDQQWLETLSDLPKDAFSNCFRDGIDVSEQPQLLKLPPLAKLVAWLIVTHHKLPVYPAWLKDKTSQPDINYIESWFEHFKPLWNSYNCNDQDQKERIVQNWTFLDLPDKSSQWRSMACTLASEALSKLHRVIDEKIDWLNEQLLTTHLSRLCLILADHHYSSLTFEYAQTQDAGQWRNKNYKVYANTRWVDDKKQYKQQLDEHLTGVAYYAKKIARALPKLNHKLASLTPNNALTNHVEENDKDNFGWQDKARKLSEKMGKDTIQQGFFGINMASTGKGKTRANAKIMTALGQQTGRVRFSVALGLRVLTLQTGKEFQKELKLSNEELAIAVGGIAVKQLFENQQQQNNPSEANEKSPEENGSQSSEEWLDKDMTVHYRGNIEHSLSQWTKNQKGLDRLLAAPVLVSTIDHLIPATEGTRGGKQIPATLRLLTSDLVLDEPDDFGLNDLPALCRLVHWAGMLGCRVLLSTATIPPALANALFRAYSTGWSEFSKANLNRGSKEIICAWFDEQNKPCTNAQCTPDSFKKSHDKFVKNRVDFLKTLPAKRKGDIIKVVKEAKQTTAEAMANTIHQGIVRLHQDHAINHNEKSLSIGLIRMANIKPLIAVAKELFKKDTAKNTCIHYCIYHSRYPLAIRSFIENNLDRILNRKETDPEKPASIWQQDEIKQAIEKHPDIKHHIFIVIASPVAEVGRDHDYDWAIVEPSSMRSIIQLAGRVLRHRNNIPDKPNILLLNKNYKVIDGNVKNNGKKIYFEKPGFESEKLTMTEHDLLEILDKEQFQNITAIERIFVPKKYCENNKCLSNLALFEQRALVKKLLMDDDSAKVWWEKQPHWCGEVQRQQPFRQSTKDNAYYLWLENEHDKIAWQWKNENISPPEFTSETPSVIDLIDINTMAMGNQFWFNQSENTIYQQLASDFNITLKEVSQRFGEVRLTEYDSHPQEYSYHPYLGIFEEYS